MGECPQHTRCMCKEVKIVLTAHSDVHLLRGHRTQGTANKSVQQASRGLLHCSTSQIPINGLIGCHRVMQ